MVNRVVGTFVWLLVFSEALYYFLSDNSIDMTQLPRLFVFCLQSADRRIYLVCTGLCLYRS